MKIVEKKNLWFLISLTLISIGIIILSTRLINNTKLFNYGIDFSSGTTLLLDIKQENINKKEITNKIQTELNSLNINKNTIQFTEDNEVIIKSIDLDNSLSKQLLLNLNNNATNYELLEIDFIGPAIGKELREKSSIIVIIVAIALLIYITFRFKFNYGITAIIALIHDTLIVLTLTLILNLEVNLAYIAALLTILGYSINDTIVIFDRIRENETLHEGKPINDICNLSLQQTLARTINTSLTTLLVIISLILFGGGTIKEFCIILFIGIISGTYSSFFIASPIVALLHKKEVAAN